MNHLKCFHDSLLDKQAVEDSPLSRLALRALSFIESVPHLRF